MSINPNNVVQFKADLKKSIANHNNSVALLQKLLDWRIIANHGIDTDTVDKLIMRPQLFPKDYDRLGVVSRYLPFRYSFNAVLLKTGDMVYLQKMLKRRPKRHQLNPETRYFTIEGSDEKFPTYEAACTALED